MKKLWAYLKDDSGQTSTEYILLVAVVVLIVFRFRKTAEAELKNITEKIFQKSSTSVDDMFNSINN